MNLSYFLGKQLSRLRLGQSYYSIIASTLATISLLSLAFQISFWILIIIFPFILFCTFIIGYFLDVFNINTMDVMKSNEIHNRYLNTVDIKHQEFELVKLRVLIEIVMLLQEKKNINFNEILQKYFDEYYNKWKFKP